MNSVIPSNYKPQLSKKEIYEFISTFQNYLREELHQNMNLLEVDAPLYSTEKISSEIYETINSRIISFGVVTDEEVYSLYNQYDYWFRNELYKLDIPSGNGIFAFLNYVKRDQKDYNHETFRKKEVHIEYRYEGEFPEEKVLEVQKIINNAVLNAVMRTFETLKIKNRRKLNISYYDFIKDGLDINDPRNQIDAISEKDGATTFSNVNLKMKRPIYTADEPIFAVTTLWFPITKDSHSIIKGGIRKSYSEIEELSKSGRLDSKDEIHFAREQLIPKVPNSLHFNIDIYRVVINSLKLAHIGEIISEKQSEQIELLKKKATIK